MTGRRRRAGSPGRPPPPRRPSTGFAAFYADLIADLARERGLTDFARIARVVLDVKQRATTSDAKQRAARLGGASTGATLGSLLGGPLGAAVGAALGGFLVAASGDQASSDEVRRERARMERYRDLYEAYDREHRAGQVSAKAHAARLRELATVVKQEIERDYGSDRP